MKTQKFDSNNQIEGKKILSQKTLNSQLTNTEKNKAPLYAQLISDVFSFQNYGLKSPL